MSINKKYFSSLKTIFANWEKEKRVVQELSATALQSAKQAIFSFHRNDWKTGVNLLKTSLENIKKAAKAQEKSISSDDEGIYKSAMEEYAEAELFRQFLFKEDIGQVAGLDLAPSTYLGGLTDLIGEIQRYAMKMATERNWAELKRANETSEDAMAALVEFNFTGYLRTKFDQAKNARRKIEEIAYEVSLRKTESKSKN